MTPLWLLAIVVGAGGWFIAVAYEASSIKQAVKDTEYSCKSMREIVENSTHAQRDAALDHVKNAEQTLQEAQALVDKPVSNKTQIETLLSQCQHLLSQASETIELTLQENEDD